MTELLTIKLENLRFYSYHGLYPQERQTGGEYQVDLHIDVEPANKLMPLTDLSQTIDYTQLFAIVKGQMGMPRDLLETLAISMVEEIKAHYACKRIAVEIKKFTIPINEFSGNTAVRYEWKA